MRIKRVEVKAILEDGSEHTTVVKNATLEFKPGTKQVIREIPQDYEEQTWKEFVGEREPNDDQVIIQIWGQPT
jgi:hypothetical protein